MTPYLILDDELVRAMTFAARRGVDVCIIMPGIQINSMPLILRRPILKCSWMLASVFSVIPQALSC